MICKGHAGSCGGHTGVTRESHGGNAKVMQRYVGVITRAEKFTDQWCIQHIHSEIFQSDGGTKLKMSKVIVLNKCS